jgi:hypothetical protein
MFGYTARHVLVTRKQIPLEGSRSEPQESQTDGWYIDAKAGDPKIDFYQRLSCDRKWPEGKSSHSFSYVQLGGRDQPMDRREFIPVGKPERGFALHSVTTISGTYALPDETKKQSVSKFETRVTEIQEGPLDPALFEIPSGFRQVDHIERNPPSAASAGPLQDFWQRLKASVANFFNR